MLDTMTELRNEIAALRPEIRRVVSRALRTSRFNKDQYVDECMAHVMACAMDYGARTFDPSKGSVRTHFTTFAFHRARNWLRLAYHRFEVADEYTRGGETFSHAESVPADGNPELSLVTARERARVFAAIEALETRERDLVKAFLRLGSWLKAANEIGVSPATASRMKTVIIAKLR